MRYSRLTLELREHMVYEPDLDFLVPEQSQTLRKVNVIVTIKLFLSETSFCSLTTQNLLHMLVIEPARRASWSPVLED